MCSCDNAYSKQEIICRVSFVVFFYHGVVECVIGVTIHLTNRLFIVEIVLFLGHFSLSSNLFLFADLFVDNGHMDRVDVKIAIMLIQIDHCHAIVQI